MTREQAERWHVWLADTFADLAASEIDRMFRIGLALLEGHSEAEIDAEFDAAKRIMDGSADVPIPFTFPKVQ
jgi:hypothetical protein